MSGWVKEVVFLQSNLKCKWCHIYLSIYLPICSTQVLGADLHQGPHLHVMTAQGPFRRLALQSHTPDLPPVCRKRISARQTVRTHIALRPLGKSRLRE